MNAWRMLVYHPEHFAAAVPICGWCDPSEAPQIAQIPVWVFHGVRDNIEPVKSSRDIVAALKKAGGTPKYTEYPNEGHGIWGRVYKDPNMMAWLFAQQRAAAPPAPPAQGGERRSWRHGKGSFENTEGILWTEKLGKDTYFFGETNRTDDHVELYDRGRDLTVRLYAGRCLVRFGGGEFKKVYEGGWRGK